MKDIKIIGMGMGHAGGLTLEGRQAILEAGLIIGGERILECVRHMGEEFTRDKMCIPVWRPDEICSDIDDATEEKIAVIMSGDSGFNSGAAKLLDEMRECGMIRDDDVYSESEARDINVEIYPGIGAISALAAKAGVGWEESALISLHGRSQNLYAALATSDKVFVLSGRKTGEVLNNLADSPFAGSEVFIGENMGAADERIIRLKDVGLYDGSEFDWMTTMLILPKRTVDVSLIGMDDDEFIRGDVPMTKSEVRALSIAFLGIRKNDVVYDIGCGTGSISIEASFAAMYGQVYSVDNNEEAVALTKENAEKFFCRNIEVIKGSAPDVFEDLPAPDCAFIGGSKGRMDDIVAALKSKNPKVRIVINAVSPETVTAALTALDNNGFNDPRISQISVARGEKHGNLHLMKALNPVTIITAGGMS